MYILGISAYHGDTSATLLKDGQIVAAVEEERFNRIKHTSAFPVNAIRFCLEKAGIEVYDLDHIAIPRKPSANLWPKIRFTLSHRPDFNKVKDGLIRAGKARNIREILAQVLGIESSEFKAQFHHVEHHIAHCASAFLVSGFEDAAVLSVDGFGDFLSTMFVDGHGTEMQVLGRVEFPYSLGVFYTAVTQYCGFMKYGDEYKVMGLASYGEPTYLDKFRDIILLKEGGRFALDLDYFVHHVKNVYMNWDGPVPKQGIIYSQKFLDRFGPAREPGSELTEHYENMAASLQAMLEEAYFHCLNHLYEVTKNRKLCLAGGVAFNSVANGKILPDTPFEEIFIQPAAGDGGLSLGAAFYVHNCLLGHPRDFVMTHAYWGPEYSNEEMRGVLDKYGLEYEYYDYEQLTRRAARIVTDRKVLGWFQGAMEFGPRALGNRSIIADPRWEDTRDILNSRVKHRESFRPFAPSILEETVDDYFDQNYPDPFMLKVYKVREDKRRVIPAVTHVDGTGRLQTVNRVTAPLYRRLIKDFKRLTGVPVVLNTSFNENEPIVNTPTEAVECFLRTKMDCLVLGNYLVEKASTES